MNNFKKTTWLFFLFFMIIQVGLSYVTYRNKDNLNFLMEMRRYIPYIFYFSLSGGFFLIAGFIIYRLNNIKFKSKIIQLESDIIKLKSMLYDKEEQKSQTTETKANPALFPESEKDTNIEDTLPPI